MAHLTKSRRRVLLHVSEVLQCGSVNPLISSKKENIVSEAWMRLGLCIWIGLGNPSPYDDPLRKSTRRALKLHLPIRCGQLDTALFLVEFSRPMSFISFYWPYDSLDWVFYAHMRFRLGLSRILSSTVSLGRSVFNSSAGCHEYRPVFPHFLRLLPCPANIPYIVPPTQWLSAVQVICDIYWMSTNVRLGDWYVSKTSSAVIYWLVNSHNSAVMISHSLSVSSAAVGTVDAPSAPSLFHHFAVDMADAPHVPLNIIDVACAAPLALSTWLTPPRNCWHECQPWSLRGLFALTHRSFRNRNGLSSRNYPIK